MARKLTIEEALDYCLLNPDALSDEQLLSMFPQYREQIQPLVSLGRQVQAVEITPVPAEQRAAIKERLLRGTHAGAGVHPNGTTPAAERLSRPRQTIKPARLAPQPVSLKRVLRPLWTFAAVAAVLLVFVWWSAATALADSPFYDVKLTTENALLNLQSEPANRVRAHANLAQERLHDVRAMAARGTLDKAGKALDNFDYHINGSITGLDRVQGDKRAEVARVVLASSEAGSRVMSDLSSSPALPPSIAENVERALNDTTAAGSIAADVLSQEGIDPSTLPTPSVPSIAIATPSASVEGRPRASATAGEPEVIPAGTAAAVRTNTPGPVALQTGVPHPASPAPQATSTRVPGAPPSATEQPVFPTNTPTSVLRAATATNTRVAPAPSATPTTVSNPAFSTFTPTYVPAPPARTPTFVPPPPGDTHTPTVVPVPPTIPAVDTLTPGPPAYTRTPTDTPIPSDTPTPVPTDTAVPTNTAVPPTPSQCTLSITAVDASCGSSTCVNWSANVDNAAQVGISGSWTVQLQVKEQSNQWRTIGTQSGTVTFTPGTTSLAGRICTNIPAGATGLRVWVTVTSGSPACTLRGSSGTFTPCNESGTPPPAPPSTPTPNLHATNTPHPTSTPHPTNTPHPTHTARPSKG